MLISYVRADSGKKVGVVVALSSDKIGYSLCNPLDKFDKSYGKFIAEKRAETGQDFLAKFAKIIGRRFEYGKRIHNISQLIGPLEQMEERAGRYFG